MAGGFDTQTGSAKIVTTKCQYYSRFEIFCEGTNGVIGYDKILSEIAQHCIISRDTVTYRKKINNIISIYILLLFMQFEM